MELNNNNTVDILYNSIERESEKAVLIDCPVSWGDGKTHSRSFWFPKSCIRIYSERGVQVATFLIEKLMQQNAFKGYRMKFEELSIA